MSADPLTVGAAAPWGRKRPRARLLCMLIALGVVTQRLAIPLGGGALPLAFPLYGAAVLVAMLGGDSAPRKLPTLLIGVACCSVLAASVLSIGTPSLASLGYLIALYLPFVLGSASRSRHVFSGYANARFFVGLMMLFAVLAIWQYGSQQLLHIAYHDPFDALPASLVLQGYLSSYPVSPGADLYRANAYLFLEASILSQYLALAIVIELGQARRIGVLGLLVIGLLATCSGTGIVLLAVALPILVVCNARNIRTVLLALVAVAALAGALLARPEVLNRVAEFGQRDTSATARFITPYSKMMRLAVRDDGSLLVGYGAGAADRMVSAADGLVNFSAIPKAVIEYGVVGGLPLLVALLARVWLARLPAPVAVGLIVMHLTLSGALLQPISVFLLFFFIAGGNWLPVRRRVLRTRQAGLLGVRP